MKKTATCIQEHTSQLESDKEHTVDSVFEIEHACIEDLPADFVPNIDELRIALEFVRAVKFASLNNGDLPPAVVMQLKDPLQKVLQIEKTQRQVPTEAQFGVHN